MTNTQPMPLRNSVIDASKSFYLGEHPMQQIDQFFCNVQHLAKPRFCPLRVAAVLAIVIVNSRKNNRGKSDFQNESGDFPDCCEGNADEEDCFDDDEPLCEQLKSFEFHRNHIEELWWEVQSNLRDEQVLVDGVDAVTASAEDEAAVEHNCSCDEAESCKKQNEHLIYCGRAICTPAQSPKPPKFY